MEIKKGNLAYYLVHRKILASGLLVAAFGIFVQAISGAKGYSKVPPGVPILAVTALIVYFTPRWFWTALVGFLLTALVSVGVFATSGTAYRLQHSEDIGPLIGTLVQLLGLVIALIAGVAVIVAKLLPVSGDRSAAKSSLS